MKRTTCTELLIKTIREKGITYQRLADEIDRGLVFTTLALHGQASLEKKDADKVVALLGLKEEVSRALQQVPLRGPLDHNPPNDPAIYRLYELIQVYGTTLKAIINEKFGNGIMSINDLTVEIEKDENPTGDRVKIILEGKIFAIEEEFLMKSKGLTTKTNNFSQVALKRKTKDDNINREQ
jgi:cyanate lyase